MSIKELAKCETIGEGKAEKYGAKLIAVIQKFVQTVKVIGKLQIVTIVFKCFLMQAPKKGKTSKANRDKKRDDYSHSPYFSARDSTSGVCIMLQCSHFRKFDNRSGFHISTYMVV